MMPPIINIRISKEGIVTCDNTASGEAVTCSAQSIVVNGCPGCPVFDRLDEKDCLRWYDTTSEDVARAFDHKAYIFKARI